MLNTLLPNDVRQTFDQFRRSVDQMFDNFYGYQTQQPASTNAGSAQGWTFSPVIESGWNDDFLSLRAILPGVSDKDIQVNVQNNQLVIEGERRMPEGFEKSAWTQLAYGKFYAAVTLPAGLDVDHVHCRLHNGMLDIQVPILETSKPRQIQIKTGPEQRAIAA